MNKRLVIDSSVLIPLSRRGTLKAYLQRKRKEGYQIIIPQAIAREVIDEPLTVAKNIKKASPILADKISESIQAITEAIQENLIQIETINYTRYSKQIDNARKRLSRLENKPQHTISKGDPELVALLVQLFEKSRETVFLSTADKGLIRVLKSFKSQVDYVISKPNNNASQRRREH